MLAGAPPAVAMTAVSKSFRLPHQQYSTLKERALHPFAARSYDELRALAEVSLDVRSGEFFGIVGRNGSGKSTLLKCIAGIYAIDAGEVRVDGRLSPFIELGVGFNPDLTARDNVLINAIMLGLTRNQARERFDEIIAFAELEDFVDLKLKNYSSGMSVRLGFSVAIQVDADVLLVDEVLAVGDASFQGKCFEQFDRMKQEGRTILFVTHDMGAVERFCDRALLLELGRVVDLGEPRRIARKYGELNFGHTPGASLREPRRAGPPVARITAAWCEDARGTRIVSLERGDCCAVCLEVEFEQSVEQPIFAVTFRNDVRHTILVLSTWVLGAETGHFHAGQRALVRFTFDAWIAPSRYTLTPTVTADEVPLDEREDLAGLIVEAERRSGGVVDIPAEVEIERG
jgi:ABC-type polysaccharide/polyol phosphate transport system ATPase subunit